MGIFIVLERIMNLLESRNIGHKSGIYIFYFPNGKKYVGQTGDFKKRIQYHLIGYQAVDFAIIEHDPENIEVEFEEVSEEFFDLIEIVYISTSVLDLDIFALFIFFQIRNSQRFHT